ncbi:hypothetical protein CAXC1_50002 [Candidatus Xenohaliotis californiensis]|uniref:Uncharacterized protein n=1 Tax=Candidatus Xenohaliotis californiensis TaxID=84677 RepID=A0ABM9N964_9RICK|nr:hypothetical protein CAXC1_50002 [Candidatus Xenohaliotis californiensis]
MAKDANTIKEQPDEKSKDVYKKMLGKSEKKLLNFVFLKTFILMN